MQPIMRMLYGIEAECTDEKVDSVDSSLDEFSRLKSKVANDMSQLRSKIRERDGLRADDYKAVKLSSQIRTDLATIKKDAARMRSLQVIQARLKPKEKRYLFGLIKVKVKEDVHIKDDIDHRAAIVELVMKHVDEVERVSQKYITQFSSSQKMSDILGNENSNLSGADIFNEKLKSYTGIDASKKLRSLTDGVASATVGRETVDVEAGIKQIQRINATMDTDILNIHKSVVELREVAISMNDELKLQTAVVQELTAELDVELRQMEDLNTKLSDTLVTAKKNNHIMLDVFMVLTILGLISYIYSLYNPDLVLCDSASGSASGSASCAASSAASDESS